jgi:structural maintenance of chromosomes protein 6
LKDKKDKYEKKKNILNHKHSELQEILQKAVQDNQTKKSRLKKLKEIYDNKKKLLDHADNESNKQLEEKIKIEEKAREITRNNVENWDEQPLELDRKETRKRLEAEAKKLKEQLDRGRKEQCNSGLTLDEATDRYVKSKETFALAKTNFQILQTNLLEFQDDLKNRKNAFKQHRKKNATIVNDYFDKYMCDKGFSGQCKINFPKQVDGYADIPGTLSLITNVNAEANGDAGQCTDVKQLSGGERSFTTLALLLALGNVTDMPFKVLDEYDVFLDPVARKITLNQLVDYAKNARQANRQFIIITPHDLKDITTNNLTKIIKLPDPVRINRTGTGTGRGRGGQQSILNVERSNVD